MAWRSIEETLTGQWNSAADGLVKCRREITDIDHSLLRRGSLVESPLRR